MVAQDGDEVGRLAAYAERVLAGTGLTVADADPDAVEGELPVSGSAAAALQDGWDMARRAGQVVL
ncbi:hypothetical protein DQP56_00020 [Mycolicibacter senuensis]|uniref:Uncharacterized protein n=1 Tax=Mycolicibacter longobardus TaxID=1108812 RepID=A0A1X1YAS7_9MYCO|nr:hypothetical protein AWC16_20605 [Mycolicibacter longobardus]RAV04243.1 hypothetical protein DQP56_00020 [Mycolicibacter senuensis]